MLNKAREACGLAPVKLSAELSKGCSLHAKYLIDNSGDPKIDGLEAHKEFKELKGYSEAGTEPHGIPSS